MSVPKTIMQKLEEIPARVQADPTLGDTLSNMSVLAIMGGPGSTAWVNYMTVIVGPDAPNQLARLSLSDIATAPSYATRNSAYIVANGACGVATGPITGRRVDPNIDIGLAPEP
jgi:hypothetical protein